MSTFKHHIQHWWIIIFGIILVNGLLFFGVRYLSRPQLSDGEKMRQESNYKEIIWSTWATSLRTAPAYVKLWDIQSAREAFFIWSYEGVPARRDMIRKSFLLWSKDDIVWAQEVLENTTHPDPIIRSLFLVLRAHYYCLQRKRDECEILAQDSVTLDPLSSFGLQLQWAVDHAKRKFTSAEKFFDRAQKWDGFCVDTMCLYARGTTHFYNAQYSWAITDLSSLIDDKSYGFDTKLFLWRTYYNQKIFDKATEWFQASRESAWWVPRTSDLWLARVATEQWDIEKSLRIYHDAYLSGDYGVELVTDYLFLAYFTDDVELVKTLTLQLERMIGDSPWNYLLVVRVLKDTNQLDLARGFLEKWRLFIDTIEDVGEQERYTTDFLREEHNITVKEIYQTLNTWQSIDELLLVLDTLSVDASQNAFLRWLQSVINEWVDTTGSWFYLIPQIASHDIPFIRFWYVLFRRDTKRALQIVTEMNMYAKNNIQLLRMKWAVTQRLGEEQLAARYLYQLKEAWVFTESNTTFTLRELRKEAFRAFSPRMKWMSPNLSLDFWWISVSGENDVLLDVKAEF